jgi:hypothetical protein
LIEDS